MERFEERDKTRGELAGLPLIIVLGFFTEIPLHVGPPPPKA